MVNEHNWSLNIKINKFLIYFKFCIWNFFFIGFAFYNKHINYGNGKLLGLSWHWFSLERGSKFTFNLCSFLPQEQVLGHADCLSCTLCSAPYHQFILLSPSRLWFFSNLLFSWDIGDYLIFYQSLKKRHTLLWARVFVSITTSVQDSPLLPGSASLPWRREAQLHTVGNPQGQS